MNWKEELVMTRVNGNITDFNNQIKAMSKKKLVQLIEFAVDCELYQEALGPIFRLYE